MELRLAVTPDISSPLNQATVSLYDSFGDTPFGPTLVDVDNLKEYAVVRDGSGVGSWSSDSNDTRSSNRTPMLAYAYFAAPEDDIKEIDVRVSDFWPTFTDVPITR